MSSSALRPVYIKLAMDGNEKYCGFNYNNNNIMEQLALLLISIDIIIIQL